MTRHSFPGFPRYLDRAAESIAHPEASIPARRIAPLAALANLCAQASTADDENVAGILAKAAEFRHQLHVAAIAADLMLEDAQGSKPAADDPSPIAKPRPKVERAAR